MLISILHSSKYSPNPMLKGKQTNHSVCGKHITDFSPLKYFIMTTTCAICVKIIKRLPLMLDIQFMTLLETFTMLLVTEHTANDCRLQ